MDKEKDMAIDEQNEAGAADFATENEITDEFNNISDEEDVFEDEFSSIPDSFSEDEFDFYEDGASSISSLIYDEDDANAAHELEQTGNISFTELRKEMQKLRNDAMELNQDEEDTSSEETAVAEDVQNEQEELIYETPFVLEEDFSEKDEEVSEIEEEVTDDTPEEAPAEKEVIAEDIKEANIEEQKDMPTEHVISIDRAKVRDNTPPEGRFIDTVFETVELFVFTLLAVVLLISLCFRHSVVSGDSMLNTLNDGDRLIISNLFYEPKAGDIIVFDDRSNEHYADEPIIKRVIAVSGDTVEIKDGVIIVNGEILDESEYVFWDLDGETNGSRYFPTNDDMELITVPEGEIFVLGDNRGNSKDSRIVGTIKEDSVIGKVLFRFYSGEKKAVVFEKVD
jgi:signal peptidase I